MARTPTTDTPGPDLEAGPPQVERLATLDPARRRALLTRELADDRTVGEVVRSVLHGVRGGGDAALQDFTQRFDKVRPEPFVLGPDVFQEAWDALDAPLRQALGRAARNLRTVADNTRPPARIETEVEPGLTVVEETRPLDRVGCYVPGGKAAYPSSVLMAAVPAKAAGVGEVVVASPPGPDGRPPAAVLAACHIAGVDQVVVAGGAQAIAAMAYGTESVGRVDKIVGPGNRFVTAAKRMVFGEVDIDSPAGPTEVLILADASADPEWVALDLVAQAEHAEDSKCILVTADEGLAKAVRDALPRVLAARERHEVAAKALADHGALLVADDLDAACTFARDYAPEHLQVMTADPETWSAKVPTAAATFLGHYAPVPVGDYLTGANHVLPTGGTARWASPLSVHSFLTRATRQSLTEEAAAALVDDLSVFARREGLEGHAAAFEARGREAKE